MKNKKIYSVISYLFSVGVKFSTGFLLPVFIYIFLKQKKSQKINWDNVFLYSFYLSVFVILLVTFRTTFQPWYLLFPLSLASIISFKNYIFTSTIVASVFATIIYIPYVLLTDYSKNYPQIVSNIEIIGLILTIILFFTFLIKPRLPRH
jgi:hypothetical protein